MQIAIIPMPPVVGAPLDRRMSTSINSILRSVGSDGWDWWSPDVNEVVLGSSIPRAPQNLHKMVHISRDEQWIFETVFAVEDRSFVCLYTKLISDYVDIAISLKAIDHYRDAIDPPLPLTDIIAEQYWRRSEIFGKNDIHSLVPPIFSRSSLDRSTMRLIDVIEDNVAQKRLGWRYKPIYDFEPSVLEALIAGQFIRSPFHELRGSQPFVNFPTDTWFCRDLVKYQARVSSGHVHENHELFDTIVVDLVAMRPAKISITALISHAIDGLLDLSVTRHFSDPYLGVIPINSVMMVQIKESLSSLIFKAVMAYCQLYDIDYNVFGSTTSDRSSITIEKNIHDEVSIAFHDMVHDRYVCFYTSFPLLALTTLGAGHYIQRR